MVSAALQPCPNCLSRFDLTGPIYALKADPLNDVYMCNVCGLVFKPILNPNGDLSPRSVYTTASWSGFRAAHQERLRTLAQIVARETRLASDDAIVDVGAGIGLLYEELGKIVPGLRKYVAVEPVLEIATYLKTAHPSLFVLNGEINDVVLPERAFKVALVSCVDYLFSDIRAAFEKIRSLLSDDGMVFIQRNVFVDQEGYIGQPIADLDGLFSTNPIMRNWFHTEQYVEFVGQFFDVRRAWNTSQSFPRDGGDAFTSLTVNIMCERRRHRDAAAGPPKSYREVNLRCLQRLRDAAAASNTGGRRNVA